MKVFRVKKSYLAKRWGSEEKTHNSGIVSEVLDYMRPHPNK